MATQAIAGGTIIGLTSYTSGGHYYRGEYYSDGGLWYDSVERSGNTVTIKNLTIGGNITCRYLYPDGNGRYYGWSRTWYAIYAIKNNGNIVKSVSFWQGGAGDKYWGMWQIFQSSNYNFGDYSFTVGATDTSKTLTWEASAGRTANDYAYFDGELEKSFTVTFPAATRQFKATATNSTFDLKKNSDSVGDDISSYNETWIYNDTWTISDIKANSGYYLTSTTSSTTGTLTFDQDIIVATAEKYISFDVSGTNVTFDVTIDDTKVGNDVESYSSSTVKQNVTYKVNDVKKKANTILDSKYEPTGTTSSTDITIVAGVASPISFDSSITYKTPIKVTSKCDIVIDDKSGRSRNWKFTAKLKKGSIVLETKSTTVGEDLSATLTFDRNTTTKALKVDTMYEVEWTIEDLTDTFGQTFTKSSTFTLPCLGYVVDSSSKKKISYFTITDHEGVLKHSFKRIGKIT